MSETPSPPSPPTSAVYRDKPESSTTSFVLLPPEVVERIRKQVLEDLRARGEPSRD